MLNRRPVGSRSPLAGTNQVRQVESSRIHAGISRVEPPSHFTSEVVDCCGHFAASKRADELLVFRLSQGVGGCGVNASENQETEHMKLQKYVTSHSIEAEILD